MLPLTPWFHAVGLVGVEPTPPRLKVECAADYATAPFGVGPAFKALRKAHGKSPFVEQPVGESNPCPLIERQRS